MSLPKIEQCDYERRRTPQELWFKRDQDIALLSPFVRSGSTAT